MECLDQKHWCAVWILQSVLRCRWWACGPFAARVLFFFISCPIFSYYHSHLSLWKELIRVFCCPTVQIMSLQESQTGAFWYHEFLWPMERGYNVKKLTLGAFHGCLSVFYEKCVLDIMHGSNKIKQNICTIYGRLFINPSYKMFHTS